MAPFQVKWLKDVLESLNNPHNLMYFKEERTYSIVTSDTNPNIKKSSHLAMCYFMVWICFRIKIKIMSIYTFIFMKRCLVSTKNKVKNIVQLFVAIIYKNILFIKNHSQLVPDVIGPYHEYK